MLNYELSINKVIHVTLFHGFVLCFREASKGHPTCPGRPLMVQPAWLVVPTFPQLLCSMRQNSVRIPSLLILSICQSYFIKYERKGQTFDSIVTGDSLNETWVHSWPQGNHQHQVLLLSKSEYHHQIHFISTKTKIRVVYKIRCS